jgi:sugar phosphate isomerase/epimerase
MTIKIATCGWGAPLEEFCATAAQAGYAGIEYNLDEWVGREAVLSAMLQKYNLSISACSAGGSFMDPVTRAQEINQAVEAAARASRLPASGYLKVGIYTLEMFCPPRPVGGPSDEQIKTYADGLNEVGRRCQALGVNVGIHNHCIQFLETEREIERLYERLDPQAVGLGFDTGHLMLAGCDAAAIFQRYIQKGFKVAYLHLKDLYQVSQPAGASERLMDFTEVLDLAVAADIFTWLVIKDIAGRRIVLGGGELGHRFLRAHQGLLKSVRCKDIVEYQFCELGQGSLDFKALFKVLDASGFEGWASVELDVAYRSRLESASLSRDYLRNVIGV